jgi:hypothetical protein
MKTKVIAVIVVLSTSFCAAAYSQNIGDLKGGNNTQPTPAPPVNNNGVNNNTNNNGNATATPAILSNQTIYGVYNELAKTKEYQAFEKKVKAKVNATKVGKSASRFRVFLQQIGLVKKTPVRKSQPVKKVVPVKKVQ